jgi:hypothetical protein
MSDFAVCGCDRPFRWLTRTRRNRRDEESFTLELVLQAIDRTSACDEVWLAIGASKRGRGRENEARVKKPCRFVGFGLLTVTAEAPGRRAGGAGAMEAEARSAFAHR